MITKTLDINIPETALVPRYYSPGEVLFFDIETTGFSPKSSMLYLIGTIYFQNNAWKLTQWLAEEDGDEPVILERFAAVASTFRHLIHFNGNRFDLPYLMDKYAAYKLSFPTEQLTGTDLYQMVRPLKKILKLQHLNQQSLEAFLQTGRRDAAKGGELIPVFHAFKKSHDTNSEVLLLLHNHDDLTGMVKLLPLLSYLDIVNAEFSIDRTEICQEDQGRFSLLVSASLPLAVPKPISCRLDYGYLTAREQSCRIQVNGICGTLKYFFKDYKNYYYLPAEDAAIHKSIASFIDRDYRVPAKASTCFQKRTGYFLPQKKELFTPSFKEDYQASDSYFEYTEEFQKDSQNLLTYLQNLL